MALCYYEFQCLFSLLGKDISDPNVENIIYNDDLMKVFNFKIHRPLLEDRNYLNENWTTYESEEIGLIIEIADNRVICLSFNSGIPVFNGEYYQITPSYPFALLDDLSLKNRKVDIRNIFGSPLKQGKFFDQYKLDNNIIMGVLYNVSSEEVSVISYGLSSIFSDPVLCPNRFSPIFLSLS